MATAPAAAPASGTNRSASDAMAEWAAPTTAPGIPKMDMAIHPLRSMGKGREAAATGPAGWLRTRLLRCRGGERRCSGTRAAGRIGVGQARAGGEAGAAGEGTHRGGGEQG